MTTISFQVAAQQCPGAVARNFTPELDVSWSQERNEKKKRTPLQTRRSLCGNSISSLRSRRFFAHSCVFSTIRAKPPIRAFSPLFTVPEPQTNTNLGVTRASTMQTEELPEPQPLQNEELPEPQPLQLGINLIFFVAPFFFALAPSTWYCCRPWGSTSGRLNLYIFLKLLLQVRYCRGIPDSPVIVEA